jgi:urease accessory protein
MFVLPSPAVVSSASEPVAAPGRGQLELRRAVTRTVVTRAYATAPLRLLTPANHGRAAWVYTSSYGGGLVDGDRTGIDIDVRRGAAALLSSQASTKVYRSARGTSMELGARVEDEGVLMVMPDPVVCFAGARYRQAQRFRVAAGGTLVVCDCILAGRYAAGERWEFVEYRSLLEITLGDRLLVHDAMRLRGEDEELTCRFGRFNALALVAVVGSAFRSHSDRLLAWSAEQKVVSRPELLVTASNLSDEGCLLRIAGTSGEKVSGTIRTLLDFIPPWLGDDPWARKW